MSTTIDSLDIQIKTSADQASDSLDRLADTIERITKSFGKTIQPTSGGFSAQVKGIVNGLKGYNSAARVTKKTTLSLAATFGRFYANCWLLVRGLKALWRSIEGTTDYIEAYNYFDVSFGKIASEWQHEYGKFGYDNAEAYAKSFTTRMNSILGKMSGVSLQIGEDGNALLTETGLANLGMNIREMTQAASNIASITNSVGQTGEVSLAAAQSLTALAGDIASLFNIDYSSAMTNLKSGLIGQSRALYKYGIDITNATLQTYAYEHGITKAVSEMSQAEKMQLRLLAILDQSKVAWGDLANTINSPSNMIRQFKNNIAELGTVIGQLFIPVLSKVMPFINGVTIALKRLMTTIAGFFGIKINLKDYGSGYNDDTIDGLEDVAAGYDGATAAAKKYQKTILGFDQLNKLNDNESSSGGGFSGGGGGFDLTGDILDATDEYMKAWNEAYANMEDQVQKIAGKIEKALEPVKKLFQDISIGDWFAVGGDVSTIVTNINDFFANAIDQVDWYGIGRNISDFLAGIDWVSVLTSAANLVWQGLTAALELGSGILSGIPLVKQIKDKIQPVFEEFSKNVLPKVTEKLDYLWNKIFVPFGNFVGSVLTPIVGIVIDLLKILFRDVVPPLANAVKNILGSSFELLCTIVSETISSFSYWWNSVLSPLLSFLKTVFLPVFQSVFKSVATLVENLSVVFKGLLTFISGVFSGDWKKAWEGIKTTFKGVFDSLKTIARTPVNAIMAMLEGFANGVISAFNSIKRSLNKLKINIPSWVPGYGGRSLGFNFSMTPNVYLPRYATGGFPEDGLFMANHGELVGKFSNGKTAVANNEQITQGIAQAVFPAVYNAVRSAMAESNNGGNQMIDNRIYIGEEEVARAVTRGQQKLNRRYQLSTT